MLCSTKAQASDSAAARVFNITSLAEQIFLELPSVQIFVCISRVSKHWKRIIDNPVLLQRDLFLQPLPGPVLHPNIMDEYNTIFTLDVPHAGSNRGQRVYTNPFTRRVSSHVARGWEKAQIEERFARLCASWRCMLVLQPSVSTMRFRQKEAIRDWAGSKRDVVYNAKGVTMEDLVSRDKDWDLYDYDELPMEWWSTKRNHVSARDVVEARDIDLVDE